MKFTIKNELENRIRIRLKDGKLDYVKDQRLSYAIRKIKGVKEVRVYRRTGGVAISFDSKDLSKDKLISALEKVLAARFPTLNVTCPPAFLMVVFRLLCV